jgi:1-hydroxycarotenoid 3,4-desaturase
MNPVLVIGAGIGGLSAAAALASAGREVIVIEAQAEAGGKIRQKDGIDVGPTVFTMKWVFDQVFHQVGAALESEVHLRRLDTLARHWWRDGTSFDLKASVNENVEAIARFASRAEAQGYDRFARDAARMHDTLKDSFMLAPRGSPLSLVGKAGLGSVLGIRPFETLWSVLGTYFTDPRLRQLFARYATYVGSSPFKCPATLMLIAHVEQQGVWTIAGGITALVQALQNRLEAKGVRFRFSQSVRSIGIVGGRVQHVDLASGERIAASEVIFNGDAAALPQGLLGDQAARAVNRDVAGERSLSAVTWHGVAKTHDFPLHHHNVFFSDTYSHEFRDLFSARKVPQTPTTYICKADDSGKLLLLVNAPAGPVDIQQAENSMRAHLEKCGLSLSDVAMRVTTPEIFAQLCPGSSGALYGRASHGWMAAFQRPGSSTSIKGLYLAGGSAHPGAGVPMAAISGQLASQALCRDQGSTLTFP